MHINIYGFTFTGSFVTFDTSAPLIPCNTFTQLLSSEFHFNKVIF